MTKTSQELEKETEKDKELKEAYKEAYSSEEEKKEKEKEEEELGKGLSIHQASKKLSIEDMGSVTHANGDDFDVMKSARVYTKKNPEGKGFIIRSYSHNKDALEQLDDAIGDTDIHERKVVSGDVEREKEVIDDLRLVLKEVSEDMEEDIELELED